MKVKALIRDFCPPLLLKLVRQFRNKNNITFTGNFATWAEAEKHASGYDSEAIFQRVREAALKVKGGEAVFERDSVCFYHEEYRWPILACLLSIAAEGDGKLSALDFGGALGSFYFQHRKFLSKLSGCRWAVVEQKHFVAFGRAEMQDNVLKFNETIDNCLAESDVDVVFISCVLQYIEAPYAMLVELTRAKAHYLLIDRTPFVAGDHDHLTVQSVPEAIYKASYPAWFFSRKKFDAFIADAGYRLIIEFAGDDNLGVGEYKGMLYERN